MSANSNVSRKPRFETNATVVLRSGEGDSYGAIANIHDEGAMVDIERGLEQDEIVSFILSGTEIYARIAWSSENQIGLSFFRPISMDIVAQLAAGTDAKISF